MAYRSHPIFPYNLIDWTTECCLGLASHRASQAEHKTVPLLSPYNPNNLTSTSGKPYSIFSRRHSFRKKYPPLEPGLNPALQLPAVNVKADSWLKIVVSEARDTEFS